MGASVIGFMYGAIWYSLSYFVFRVAANKTQNIWILNFVPLTVFVPVFSSVLLLKPFITNWQDFICIWSFSIFPGALVMKFLVINKFYK
jgi:hypothetical protein